MDKQNDLEGKYQKLATEYSKVSSNVKNNLQIAKFRFAIAFVLIPLHYFTSFLGKVSRYSFEESCLR